MSQPKTGSLYPQGAMSFSGPLTSHFCVFQRNWRLEGQDGLLRVPCQDEVAVLSSFGKQGLPAAPFSSPRLHLALTGPRPQCLSSIHTPAIGNPGHPIGLRCLNTVRGALCGRQDPCGRPCSEEGLVWVLEVGSGPFPRSRRPHLRRAGQHPCRVPLAHI